MLAAELALAGRVEGIVTAPLNKAALWAAGHHYPGHTELLAERCGASDVAMMLYLASPRPAEGRQAVGKDATASSWAANSSMRIR